MPAHRTVTAEPYGDHVRHVTEQGLDRLVAVIAAAIRP
jgi:hypothetical protein